MEFVTIYNQRRKEKPHEKHLKEVILSAEEYQDYLDQKKELEKLKKPWVRNANKDRNLRPARSHHGYRLLSIKETTENKTSENVRYRVEFETPYEVSTVDFHSAKVRIKSDTEKIKSAFGYEALSFLGGDDARGKIKLERIQLMADSRRKYYHISGIATHLPTSQWADN